ncbi:SpoIIE family protein phosphatase [Mucisphaera sp.]|uniref:SpoIIE family protein phosphatase n=1 Tax=Mucisphaera sp. TaxID=2913024 RepID=UPI003D0F94E7
MAHAAIGTDPVSSVDRPKGSRETVRLISIAGPRPIDEPLTEDQPITLGRRAGNTIQLIETDSVSREHAMLLSEKVGGTHRWFLVDRGSRHGTRLNGIRLKPDQRYPIEPDDLIELSPWVFQVIQPGRRKPESQLSKTFDDTTHHQAGQITLIDPDGPEKQARGQSPGAGAGWMNLLLSCAEAIHEADDEQTLAATVLDAAVKGTGYSNAAILRPMPNDGEVHVVAARGSFAEQQGGPSFSRSLIRRSASEGLPSRLTRQQSGTDLAVSVLELNIDEALCVPLKLGTTVAGFLYLDQRAEGKAGGSRPAGRTSQYATEFAVRLGQFAALALSNLMRLDLQKRYSRVESDLAAAAEAQAFVLPEATGKLGRVTYSGASRPGRIVSGDFFDVISLDDHQLVLTLGDVAGKGVAASVLMTASQGYVHAAFRHTADPARVAEALNGFLQDRCADHRFVTFWAGLIDLKAETLTYVDAGHGYALLQRPSGELLELNDHGGPPIGVAPSIEYRSAEIEIRSGGRLVVVSDGLVEQQAKPDESGAAEEFGFTRLKEVLGHTPEDASVVDAIFQAVVEHAGRDTLADDATVVSASWY